MPKPEPEQTVKLAAEHAVQLEHAVADRVAELKSAQEQIDSEWATVKDLMITHNIKSIKGDWGTLTIAEKLMWDYDSSQLPAKFFKKVVDTSKMSKYYRLEGKPPKAAFPRVIKFLQRRIK